MQEQPSTERERPDAQTLRRGLSILKLLARYQVHGGLGVSEIARKLELSKATTVRLTRTLMDEQFLAQDETTKRYRLGPESFAVGLAAEPNYTLQRVAAPGLRAVALETGDFVFFTVRHGLEAICLSRESGDLPYPQASLRVGDRHPLGLGAGGLAILAALPKDEADAVLKINAPAIRKRYPNMTLDVVQKMLDETRQQGYAVIRGVLAPGFWGIGVPVLEGDGQPVAAVVLNTLANRLSEARQAVIAVRLQKLCRELTLPPGEN